MTENRRGDDQRLVRMESKIDVLTDSMAKLIALETHITHLVSRVDRIEVRVDKMEDRQRASARSEAQHTGSSDTFERFMLVFFSSGIAIGLTLLLERVFA